MRIGAIEAGGTKFVYGVGNEHGVIEKRVSFPTEAPDKTIGQVIEYFRDKRVEAIGIGMFGPINLNPASPRYGFFTTTPKTGWTQYPFLPEMKNAFDIPFGWDTDVNAAAYGEAIWGAAKGLDSCVYYTVGTGVGVGVYAEGRLIHGLVHPEGGHLRIRRHPNDTFPGICPYHGDCLEGMAAGPAIERRWGVKGGELAANHQAWTFEAYYITEAIVGTILTLSPKKVILGGGVMHQRHLFPQIREETKKLLNGYVSAPELTGDLEGYIVSPGLGDNAGLAGALALGLSALKH